jgi:ATP-dependent protease HslVU (ClpYQ) ATPase subunit
VIAVQTEVGFHGVDVDVMVRDLVDASIAQVKLRKRKEVQKVRRYAFTCRNFCQLAVWRSFQKQPPSSLRLSMV